MVVNASLLLNRDFPEKQKHRLIINASYFKRRFNVYRGFNMDLLKKCAEIYSGYVDCNYTFYLDCDLSVKVEFRDFYFHHLVGLQYLTDIVQVKKELPNNSASAIYKKILKGKITHYFIRKSVFYNKIDERISHFIDLGEVISSEFIVDFDYTKVPKTDLMSKYLLYKKYENGYSILGLKYNDERDVYIPETFIFEHTDYYVKNQISYKVTDIKVECCKNK